MATPYKRPPNWDSIDALLRKHGFTVLYRRKSEEPLWKDRDGAIWLQSAAFVAAANRENNFEGNAN